MKTAYADMDIGRSQAFHAPKLAAVLAIITTSYLMLVVDSRRGSGGHRCSIWARECGASGWRTPWPERAGGGICRYQDVRRLRAFGASHREHIQCEHDHVADFACGGDDIRRSTSNDATGYVKQK